eukprot:227417_1
MAVCDCYCTSYGVHKSSIKCQNDGVRNSKAIVYGSHIYNIGGDHDEASNVYYDNIDIIEALDLNIENVSSYSRRQDIVVPGPNIYTKLSIVNDILYIFGGQHEDTWDKMSLIYPTTNPTYQSP